MEHLLFKINDLTVKLLKERMYFHDDEEDEEEDDFNHELDGDFKNNPESKLVWCTS